MRTRHLMLIACIAAMAGCDAAAGSFTPSVVYGRLAIQNQGKIDIPDSIIITPCSTGVGTPASTTNTRIAPGATWFIDLLPACYNLKILYATNTGFSHTQVVIEADKYTLTATGDF